jgi:hypothetical protein
MGWWAYCVSTGLQFPSIAQVAIGFAIFGALVRVAMYCSTVRAPFNVLARIGTGRFILPGFDQVLVTPILTVVTGVLGAAVIRRSGSWYALAEACIAGLLWLLLLGGKPTLRNWLLTGYHRYQVPGRAAGTRVFLKPI